MKLVEHSVLKGMYYVQWPDGTLSYDFYNKTWAKEHAATVQEKERLANHYKHAVKPLLQARGAI